MAPHHTLFPAFIPPIFVQSLTGIPAPAPVALNMDFLLAAWRFEERVDDSERRRVLRNLEESGTKFWNVLALQVRANLLRLSCIGSPETKTA
jgi:hypothetical protein